ncbi:MAG: hypothetical protein CBC35_07515 [Planctomycetes bacterium TMED75]|nr:hypothetical protein [Planctomycetaceae bacterium]OUU92343.1 MAG: hypothetical protein CBC35_07515 [Planctomycetes bacterium TMED75]
MARKTPAKSTPPAAGMPIVVLHGPETFLIEEYTRRLVTELQQAHGEIEQFNFDGASCTLAMVLDELRSYGLMQSHKLVVIDGAAEFMRASGHRPALERYAEDPMSEATLLLRSREWRPGNFDKAVKSKGTVIKCNVPGDADALRWCVARAEKRYSVQIVESAARLLIERIGPMLSRLDTELGKLASSIDGAAEGEAVITRDAVVELVGLGREEQAWMIQEPILRGDRSEAVKTVQSLYDVSRAPSVLMMWACIDLARKLNEAAILLEQGQSAAGLARPLQLWGAAARSVPAAAGRLGSHTTGALYQRLLEMDRRAKTGRMPPLSDAPASREATRRTLECVAVEMADRLTA